MTIRQGSENFVSKLEEACALAGIAMSELGYTAVQPQQKKVVKLSASVSVCLSMFLCLSLSLFSLR